MEIKDLPHIANIKLSQRDYNSFATVIEPDVRERLREINLQCCSFAPDSVEFRAADLEHYHGLQIDEQYHCSSNGLKGSGVILKVAGKFRIVPWLEWKPGITARKYDRKIFERLFTARDRYRLDTPLKKSSYPIPGANFLDGLYCSGEHDTSPAELVEFRDDLLKLAGDDGRNPADSLAQMLQIRDGLECIINRNLTPLTELETRIQDILKVTIVETLRAQECDETEVASQNGSRRLPGRMYEDLQRAMSLIHFGHRCDSILPDSGDSAMGRVLDQVRPVMLGICARQGLFFYLTQRDELLAEVLPLDRKRLVVERMIAAAFTDRRIRPAESADV